MKKVFLLSTGNEIVSGEHTDTNLEFLRRELKAQGFAIAGLMTVPDDTGMLAEAVTVAAHTADLLVMTGGLGPTFDDLTRTQVTKTLQGHLEKREEELRKIESFFSAQGRDMPANNENQAYFPRGSTALPNPNGTAAGIYWPTEKLTVAMLPGPPGEMQPMFKEHLLPLLERDFAEKEKITRIIYKLSGISESRLAEKLDAIWDVGVGIERSVRASVSGIELVVQTEKTGKAWLFLQACLQREFGEYIFGYGEDTLLSVCAKLMRQQQLQVALAESCTGGLIMRKLTDLPGSSAYLWGGMVCYSNDAKEKFLQVSPSLLAEKGAVSVEVAEAMLQGILRVSGADLGIAVTGIAGPDGGSREKPVGLVYIAVGSRENFVVKEYHFQGSRYQIRQRSLYTALELLRRRLLQN